MKRTSAVVLLLAMLVVALPVQAQQIPEPELLAPCTNTTGAEVLTLDGLSTDIATPAGVAYSASSSKDFVLDLAGEPVNANRRVVDAVMTWDIRAEDYDLDMPVGGTEDGHSERVQPLASAEEAVFGEVRHCQRFAVEASAWAAAAGLSTLVLDLAVR
jgi:hypothetical protein